MRNKDAFKPAVTNRVLLFLAGFMWICVGTMLLAFAYSWLCDAPRITIFLSFGVGIVAALFVHHFGFLKIVDKNIDRILPMGEKRCIFSFISWKSYFLVIIMVTFGSLLRHSTIPLQYLAILYTTIGLALILSSIRYMRVFIRQFRI
jgi:hypothetical protein